MIKRSIAFLSLLVAAPLSAQDASITLFSSGRVLVRRTITVAVPAGSSTQRLALGVFEPATLTSNEAGVSFTRVSYDPAISEEALLRRSIGKTLSYVRPGKEDGSAMLLALDPERWRIFPGDGASISGVMFGRPGPLRWPTELVPTAPLSEVQVESDRARPSLNVLYQTSGAAWSAQYRIFVGGTARIEGSAMLSAGRLDMSNAEVQLLAGNIGAPQPRYEMMMAKEAAMGGVSAAADVASEEAVGEAHLYTLPGRVTFIPGTQTVMPLFAPVTAKAERRYQVRGVLPYYGGIGQENEEQVIPVEVSWRLDRKLATTFGDLPLPAGSVTVFDTDKGGRTQLIGMGTIGHTAAGEMLTVRTGTAFDVTAKRSQTEFATTRATNTSRTIATMGYQFILQNAKDSAVTVEVLEERGGEWSVLASSVPPQKRSTTRTAFVVTVPAKGTATLTYRLRVVW